MLPGLWVLDDELWSSIFTALGLAGNVVEFVDFSSKLLGSAYEIYKSAEGLTEEHAHLAKIQKDFRDFIDRIDQQSSGQTATTISSTSRSKDEEALEKLAGECRKVAVKLLGTLNDL